LALLLSRRDDALRSRAAKCSAFSSMLGSK